VTATLPPAQAATASLRQYLQFLWRRKLSLLLPVLVAVGVAYGLTSRQASIYESFTDLLFTPQGAGASDQVRAVSIPTEARVATSPGVLVAAAKTLGPKVSAGSLAGSVKAKQTGDIAVLRITATNRSPQQAAHIAAAVAQSYLDERAARSLESATSQSTQVSARLAEIASEIDRLSRDVAAAVAGNRQDQAAAARRQIDQLAGEQSVQQARLYQSNLAAAGANRDVSILVPAEVPGSPVSPRPRQAAAVAGLVGLLVGLGLAMVREHLGTTLSRVSEIEGALGVPVLSVVPQVERRQLERVPVAVLGDPDSDTAEAYRILRTNLTVAGVADDIRVVLVTSAISGEGKSTTAANMAAAFAETGVETLLVDADTRRPNLHKLFGCSNERGLTTLLDGHLEQTPEYQKRQEVTALVSELSVAPHLSVLPAGPALKGPAQMVTSPRQLATVVEMLRKDYLVDIDAPPVLPVADVGALTGIADAVLGVVRPGLVSQPVLAQLATRLKQLNAPLLGAVVNAPDRSSFEAGGPHGYYGYGSAPTGDGSAGAFARLLRMNR
jgi:receptor protein-tyrosine kinase